MPSDVMRRGYTRPRAPATIVIFFPGLTVHEVLPVRSGTRTAIIWWVHGHPPPDGTTSTDGRDAEVAAAGDARTAGAASSCDGLSNRESIGIAIKYRTRLVESRVGRVGHAKWRVHSRQPR